MKNLECSSKGDKRFSAFYAMINGRSIENIYQSVKRNKLGNKVYKGQYVDHCIINGKKYPASILTPYYRYLWYIYLKNNPELVKYASQFNSFSDMFRGKSINCQADCIRAFVNKDQEFFKGIKVFLK